MEMIEKIRQNNALQKVSPEEVEALVQQADRVYRLHFAPLTWFERSIFINWTCAIADCKYCYLSTKPKFDAQLGTTALRSRESILAEALVCKVMGWPVGYITGGLRVESVEYLSELAEQINLLLGNKIMMNFGPYSRPIIERLQPHISGMGSAIESFDEKLHQFICPSKPLSSLLHFLQDLHTLGLQKLITIILGLGERKDDVERVIENIRRYQIETIQLCFLKSQEKTVFQEVPPPDPQYMAWWIARIRIACPTIKIKVALVPDRLQDLSLYLRSGANAFTRFAVFQEFASRNAKMIEEQCTRANRRLQSNITHLPERDWKKDLTLFDHPLREKIIAKADQYFKRLEGLQLRNHC